MVTKQKDLKLDFKVYELIKGMGGKIVIESGIVTATFPDGQVWDFTIPMRNQVKEK